MITMLTAGIKLFSARESEFLTAIHEAESQQHPRSRSRLEPLAPQRVRWQAWTATRMGASKEEHESVSAAKAAPRNPAATGPAKGAAEALVLLPRRHCLHPAPPRVHDRPDVSETVLLHLLRQTCLAKQAVYLSSIRSAALPRPAGTTQRDSRTPHPTEKR